MFRYKASMNKGIIIFSGYNERAVISFIRTLEKNKIHYCIIAKSKEDSIFLSSYKNKVIGIRQYKNLDLEEILDFLDKGKKAVNCNQLMIAPSSEALNRFLLEYKTIFENHNCIIPLTNKSLYKKISDKYSFGQMCLEYQILIPEELVNNGINEYPVVAKPKEYNTKNYKTAWSPVILNTEKEYREFIRIYPQENFYIQRYINGRSFYLLYYIDKNGVVYKYSQENLLQQPHGKSIIAATNTDVHEEIESEKYEKMFLDVKFRGFIMIEIRKQENSYYMIEANPRFWGPSQLFVDANANFFECFLKDFGYIETVDFSPVKNRKICYFWFGGAIAYLKKLYFINMNKEKFLFEINKWIECDIYKRLDTIDIFLEELTSE